MIYIVNLLLNYDNGFPFLNSPLASGSLLVLCLTSILYDISYPQ